MVYRSYSVPSIRRLRPLAALASACFLAPALAADGTLGEPPADRVVADPVLAPMLRSLTTTPRMRLGISEQEAADPDKNPLLNIRLTNGRIYNPATQRFDQVRLRSYVAEGIPHDPFTPFVAPTLRAKPGDTIRIALNNELEPQPNCTPPNINTPHCFNSTNLHSHGLWVSPTGNSDNVLITIRPKVSFEYEYNIPPTHPAGTFWYHPHLHGSTALQVSSGMAGALIVHGDRAPTPTRTGDIDTLLRDESGASYKERIVLFQQVAYACRTNPDDPNSPIKKNPDGTWACDRGDVGTINNYDQLGFGVWGPSGRYTSINGQIMPRFPEAVAGRVERWRNIHAGIRDSINLQFVPMRSGAKLTALRKPGDHEKWISRNCVGAPLTQFEIASDGLTHERAIRRTQTLLQPGYRSDLLMVFPTAGTWCVIDGNIPATGSVSGETESRRLLGTVSVAPGLPVGNDPAEYLARTLVRSASRWMPADVKEKVVADLVDGLRLNAFVPHASITDEELTKVKNPCTTNPALPATSAQCVTFNIANGKFMVNDQPYDPKTARTLTLGNVEEWMLASAAGSHPFHIHVNPFQVSRILNPQGVDVSVPGSGDPDYEATQGTWRDTLFVKGGYSLYVRTRYQRYIGEYVLHCHILDHEDQGMMQNVRVVLPDGQGGAEEGGHH
ncbi:MAG: multicopper oxidase domain-containing protein [Rhodanobacteraceae bacterium]|nr:multicopper oxidase domain-containing protein [Rhodanobacteraceae bacterium]